MILIYNFSKLKLKLVLSLTSVLMLIFFNSNLANSQTPRYIDSRDLAVMIDVKYNQNPPSITLNWAKNQLAVSYEIRRKALSDMAFPQGAIITLDSNITTYTDNTVKVGTIYEYEVRANSNGSVILRLNNAQGQPVDSTVALNYIAFGYTTSGINAEIQKLSTVLVVVDETIAEPLVNEINRLKEDLVTEGYHVITVTAPRAETFDKDKVKTTKELISAVNSVNKLDYIYLLGRVAVPYSGDTAPDGHVPDHRGAWPADVYYGMFDESFWTDFSVNISGAARDQNRNIPGDGKFDQNVLYTQQGFQYNASAGVGRVDFYDMPAFSKSEIELLKAYLDKNHNYRTGKIEVVNKGLIDDNFGARNYIEAFASSGWRNFGTLVGSENVEKADYFTKLGTDSYLWAYGTGGGTYKSAGGIGNTSDFATKPVKNIFSILFGSYFGDWDSQDNFMRASLANDGNVLTCSWSARPHWYYHHMGLGYPIGYSALSSINNYTGYLPNYYFINNGTIYTTGIKGTHAALLGDPTLTMNDIDKVSKPSELTIVQKGYKHIELQWTEPDTELSYNYDIYRAENYYGPYIKLNVGAFNKTIDVIGNTYIDDYNTQGKVYYMVRKRDLKNTNSGSFYNLSRGIIGEIEMNDLTSVETENSLDFDMNLYPNPVIDNLSINIIATKFTNGTNLKLELTSITGEVIKTIDIGNVLGSTHSINIDVKSLQLTAGVYYINLISDSETLTKKFIFNR